MGWQHIPLRWLSQAGSNKEARPHPLRPGPSTEAATRLLLVVLERELELLQRRVDRADRFHAMAPEVMRGLLQV